MTPREVPVAQFWDGVERMWQDSTSAGEDHPLQEVIADVLAGFSETDRDILVMSLIGDLSVRQIAENVKLSKTEVHRRQRVLIPELKQLLAERSEVGLYLGADTADGASSS